MRSNLGEPSWKGKEKDKDSEEGSAEKQAMVGALAAKALGSSGLAAKGLGQAAGYATGATARGAGNAVKGLGTGFVGGVRKGLGVSPAAPKTPGPIGRSMAAAGQGTVNAGRGFARGLKGSAGVAGATPGAMVGQVVGHGVRGVGKGLGKAVKSPIGAGALGAGVTGGVMGSQGQTAGAATPGS